MALDNRVKDSILSFDHIFILLSQASSNDLSPTIAEDEFDFLNSVSLFSHLKLSYKAL